MARDALVALLSMLAIQTAAADRMEAGGNRRSCCRCVCANQVLCADLASSQEQCNEICSVPLPCDAINPVFFPIVPSCGDARPCPASAPAMGAPVLGSVGLGLSLIGIAFVARRRMARGATRR